MGCPSSRRNCSRRSGGGACPGHAGGDEDFREEIAGERTSGGGAVPEAGVRCGGRLERRVAGGDVFSARCSGLLLVVSFNRGGRVGRNGPLPAGAAQVGGPSFDRGSGRRVDQFRLARIEKQSWQVATRVAAVSGLPIDVDSPGHGRAAPWGRFGRWLLAPSGGDGITGLGTGACPGRNGRSVLGGCGGPVLDVEVAHPGLIVEVVVSHVRVVGRRWREHDEHERGSGGKRGRPAVDVTRHREPRGDVAVRRVGVDGSRCALPAATGVLNFPRQRSPSSKLRT